MAQETVATEIERLIRQKEDELKALRATMRILSGEKTATYSDSTPNVEAQKVATNEFDWLELGAGDPEPTLAERVEDAIQRFPEGQEFTVPHIEAALKKSGFTVAGKSPRSRLAMIMTKLEKDGVVVRTARPKGFRPHRFKRAKGARKFSLVK